MSYILKKPRFKNFSKTKLKQFIYLIAFLIGIPVFILCIKLINVFFFTSRETRLLENRACISGVVNAIGGIHRELYNTKYGRYNHNVMELNYYSESLTDFVSMNVYIPPGYKLNHNIKRYPVVYFLHGAFDGEKDHWFTFDRREFKSSHAEISATKMIMKKHIREVIMVALDEPGGFFTSIRKDRNFERAFINEIIPYIESTFSASGERAITGLSSGGYYALYFAINYPNLFQHAGATSGSFFLGNRSRSILTLMRKKFKNVKKLKTIYLDMGNDDPGNTHENIIIYNYLLINGIRTRLDFVEGGHSFQVWRGHPVRFLKYIFSLDKPLFAPN